MCQKSKTQSNAVGKSLRYYLFVFIFCVFGVAQVNAQLRLRIDGIDRVGKLKFDSCTDFEENKDPYGIPYTKDNGEKIYLLPKPGTIATVTYASEEKDKIIIKDVDKNGVLIASSITIKSSSEGELDTSLFPNIENIEIQIIQEYGSTIPDTYFVAIGKISGTINEIQLDGLLTSGKLVFDKKCARFKKSNKSGVIVQGMDGKEYTLLPCERSIAKFTDKDGIVKEIMFSGIGEKNLLEASLVTHGEIKATVSRKETEKVFPKIPNTVQMHSKLSKEYFYRATGQVKGEILKIIVDGVKSKGQLEFWSYAEFTLSPDQGLMVLGEDGKVYFLLPRIRSIGTFTGENGKSQDIKIIGTNNNGTLIARSIKL